MQCEYDSEDSAENGNKEDGGCGEATCDRANSLRVQPCDLRQGKKDRRNCQEDDSADGREHEGRYSDEKLAHAEYYAIGPEARDA